MTFNKNSNIQRHKSAFDMAHLAAVGCSALRAFYFFKAFSLSAL